MEYGLEYKQQNGWRMANVARVSVEMSDNYMVY